MFVGRNIHKPVRRPRRDPEIYNADVGCTGSNIDGVVDKTGGANTTSTSDCNCRTDIDSNTNSRTSSSSSTSTQAETEGGCAQTPSSKEACSAATPGRSLHNFLPLEGAKMSPSVVIIGADKGGVGKTTITRVLLEYFAAHGVAYRAFDSEVPNGDLRRFHPDAKVIDIGKVQAQMEVFDVQPDFPVTIVDLRAGMFSNILEELDKAKLLEDVRSGHLNLILIHVLGPTINSIAEIASIAERIGGGAKHLLVKNYINDTTFFEWDADEADDDVGAALRRMADVTISVPQLAEIACETIQKLGCKYQTFVSDAKQSRMLRGRVIGWMQTVYAEFDRVNLLDHVRQTNKE